MSTIPHGRPKRACPNPEQGTTPCTRATRRLYVAFHGFDEADSAWIDDSDEWSWAATPPGGIPPAPPVAGAYQPGLIPGPIDKIFLVRTIAGTEEQDDPSLELFIKWKGLVRGRRRVRAVGGPRPKARVVRRRERRSTPHAILPSPPLCMLAHVARLLGLPCCLPASATPPGHALSRA